MPNHVKNVIRISAEPERISEILQEIQNDEIGIGSLDFNKLIPMPESLNIESSTRTEKGLKLFQSFQRESMELSLCNLLNRAPEDVENGAIAALIDKYGKLTEGDPELMNLGEQCYNNIVQYGCPTWYEWANENWGTKWNAYNFAPYSDRNTVSFHTAWNSIPKILTALSLKFPDVRFDYSWADEDIGYNVGVLTYQNGKVTDSFVPEGGTKEAYELAAEIQGGDLEEDYNLYLSDDETTYEYREEFEDDEDLEV